MATVPTIGGVPADLLVKAVLREDEEAVMHIVSSLARKEIWWFELRQRPSGDTALHVAVRAQCIPIIRTLCESCHKMDDQKRQNCNVCKFMLEIGNSMGKKALHEAATLCSSIIITYLLHIGAEVDSLKAGDWTPLMLVSVKNGVNATLSAKVLLENGANPLLVNKDGWTSLHLACRTGNSHSVDMLLARGGMLAAAHTSSNGRSPLHIACLHGHREIVQKLCETKVYLDLADACGLTPLHETIRGGHVGLFRLLIAKGADVHKTDLMHLTCLHIAASSARLRHIEILLFEFDFIIDEPTKFSGLTPLHCAIRAGQTSTVRYLINLGANPDLQDARGRKAIDFINGCDSAEMIEVLSAAVE